MNIDKIEKDDMMELGKAIKFFREKKVLSIEELADKAKVDIDQLIRFEDTGHASTLTLMKVIKALEYSLVICLNGVIKDII